MITTVTLNPAVDKTYAAGGLIMGQVNRMKSVQNLAGGKGINVAKILRQYGYPVTALGFLGGYTGSFIEDYVRGIKAVCAFTHVREETRSSINVVAEDGYVTELLEPGPRVSKGELEDFLADYKLQLGESELMVLSGSIPLGVPYDIYATLIRLAKKQGIKAVLDTSGSYLTAGVKENPFMLKPNLKELEYLMGYRISGLEEAAAACRELVQNGIDHVMVSMGKKGLLYGTAGAEHILYAKSPAVQARNTVGCGDSVVASFCMSFLKQEDDEETLRKAAARSAASAELFGIGVVSEERAEELYNEVVISRMG